MTLAGKTEFIENRIGEKSSALFFKDGHASVPTGSYFGEEFTLTVWIKFNQFFEWARVFDFGDGMDMNNIFLALVEHKPGFFMRSESSSVVGWCLLMFSSKPLKIDDFWTTFSDF